MRDIKKMNKMPELMSRYSLNTISVGIWNGICVVPSKDIWWST